MRIGPSCWRRCEAACDAPSLYDESLRLLARRGLPVPTVAHRARLDPAVRRQRRASSRPGCVVYRDPKQHWDLYQLGEELTDLEDAFRLWRFRHVTTVERIIGFKRGTGGTGGVAICARCSTWCCSRRSGSCAPTSETRGARHVACTTNRLRRIDRLARRPARAERSTGAGIGCQNQGVQLDGAAGRRSRARRQEHPRRGIGRTQLPLVLGDGRAVGERKARAARTRTTGPAARRACGTGRRAPARGQWCKGLRGQGIRCHRVLSPFAQHGFARRCAQHVVLHAGRLPRADADAAGRLRADGGGARSAAAGRCAGR